MVLKISKYSGALDLYLNCIKGDRGIQRLYVSKSPDFEEMNDEELDRIAKFLTNGKEDITKIPLDVEGTEFQKKVWEALREIPAGEVRTYSDIAKRIGKPGAARAVGNAVGSNRALLLIPCHRVVSASGLGGFSAEGGLHTKRKILDVENRARSGKLKVTA